MGLRVALLVLLLPLSCGKMPGNLSRLQHDPGRTENEASPFQWVEVNNDEYADFIAKPLTAGATDRILADSHPATQRLQFWMDRLDDMLRARDAHRLEGVPRPTAKVVLSADTNAMVSGVPECLSFNAVFSGITSTVEAKPDAVAVYFRDAGVFQYAEHGCKPTSRSQINQIALLRWALSANKSCTFTEEGGTVTFSPGCIPSNSPIKMGTKVSQIAVNATASQITFLSPVLSLLNEDEIVTIIAHELGHYYMSHQTAPRDGYNYFYRLGAKNPATKPVPDASATADGKKLVGILSQRIPFDHWASIPGQKLSSVFYDVFAKLASTLNSGCMKDTSCDDACKNLDIFFNGSSSFIQRILVQTRLSGVALDPAAQAYSESLYGSYEGAALQCIAMSKLESRDNNVSNGLNAAKFIETMHGTYLLGSLTDALPALSATASLQDLINEISKAIIQIKQVQDGKLTEARLLSKDLGWYTIEQEADELATEWVDLIGINPAALSSSMVKFANLGDPNGQGLLILPAPTPGAECEKLYADGWLDKQRQPVMVPIANWEDVHHSSCFRAFNAFREVQALHEDRYKTSARPRAPGLAWADITADLHHLEQTKLPMKQALKMTQVGSF